MWTDLFYAFVALLLAYFWTDLIHSTEKVSSPHPWSHWIHEIKRQLNVPVPSHTFKVFRNRRKPDASKHIDRSLCVCLGKPAEHSIAQHSTLLNAKLQKLLWRDPVCLSPKTEAWMDMCCLCLCTRLDQPRQCLLVGGHTVTGGLRSLCFDWS